MCDFSAIMILIFFIVITTFFDALQLFCSVIVNRIWWCSMKLETCRVIPRYHHPQDQDHGERYKFCKVFQSHLYPRLLQYWQLLSWELPLNILFRNPKFYKWQECRFGECLIADFIIADALIKGRQLCGVYLQEFRDCPRCQCSWNW